MECERPEVVCLRYLIHRQCVHTSWVKAVSWMHLKIQGATQPTGFPIGFIAPTHRLSTVPWGAMHRCQNRHAGFNPHASRIQVAGPFLGSWPWDQRRSHFVHHTPTWKQPHPGDWRRVSPTRRHRPWGARGKDSRRWHRVAGYGLVHPEMSDRPFSPPRRLPLSAR